MIAYQDPNMPFELHLKAKDSIEQQNAVGQ
jgi:hypothetical protein